MNVDSLHIETTPVDVSRRKLRAGLQGMKKDERKKLTIMLLCLIGGGTTFGLIVIIWAFATASSPVQSPRRPRTSSACWPKRPIAARRRKKDPPAKNRPRKDKDKGDSEPEAAELRLTSGRGRCGSHGPQADRGPPPKGAKTDETEVLIVQVKLNLKEGETKQVELTSWMDEQTPVASFRSRTTRQEL